LRKAMTASPPSSAHVASVRFILRVTRRLTAASTRPEPMNDAFDRAVARNGRAKQEHRIACLLGRSLRHEQAVRSLWMGCVGRWRHRRRSWLRLGLRCELTTMRRVPRAPGRNARLTNPQIADARGLGAAGASRLTLLLRL
jgi:hypothetical protein